ncbi:MAG: S53 family peptidase, partial [Acidobacteriaceae bacterium]|nr:S53 family peptidase [Acidobacteriaceae bacterium]
LSEQYIVDNNLADIMTESYGDCEANYTQAEGQFYSSLAQQAAAEGITYTVASGDSGAEGCDDPSSVTVATGPVSVNILSSTPYDVAVGGTEFNENGNSAYWSGTNSANFASAQSYIPEVVWNESCTVAQCGSANAGIYAGGGGPSILFSKPSWQNGVAGIPNDGVRDVPDVSLTSASHDFYLLCLDGSCTERRGQSSFSGVSGTSAATPSFAGIMALIVQYTGSRQGQAAANLYSLAANESLASCNSSGPASNCIFNDVTVGNNAVPGETGYGTSTARYQAGVGYDLATGLGSVNVNNLVLGWSSSGITTSQIHIGIDSPSSQNSTVIGLSTFSGWALADTGSVNAVAIAIDSIPSGNAIYRTTRTDICALYSSANCPNVGWSFPIDTTLLADGSHTLDATVTTNTGQVYTASSNFTVANWTSSNPMKLNIDIPNSNSPVFSGVTNFAGWAIDSLSAVTQLAVMIDGVSYGSAIYGIARTDVCTAFPGEAGCPNVGWNLAVDTTQLAEGTHTISITPMTAGGQRSTISASFTVANTPSNVLTVSIDQPAAQSAAFSGIVNFGGWAIGTSVPVSSIAVTIDGIAYGSAVYGSNRQDVCNAHPGRPSCPNVGWNFGLDTTQLVNGLHILGLTVYAGTVQYTTDTRTFTVSNSPSASPVLIGIDLPSQQNSILVGQTSFSGWAVDNGAAINTVTIAIDGARYGTASYGVSRPDVCAVYPGDSNCPNVGWTLPVDTSQLADGAHTVTVTAAGAQTNTLSSQFTVANWTTSNPMKISIDYPNSQTGPLSGQVGIGGWAIDQIAAIGKITVSVDNLSLGAAVYGGSRADVCAIFSGAIDCPNVGWNYILDTNLLSDGPHTLAVSGTTASGQSSTFTTSFQVANGASSPLRIGIDIPSANETLMQTSHIGGWALDSNGPQIVSVGVLVDGVLNGVAVYGGTRTDVCSHFPNAGGCPNVGWNYELDTTPFANGTHTLDIRALAADGSIYTGSQTFAVANQP